MDNLQYDHEEVSAKLIDEVCAVGGKQAHQKKVAGWRQAEY